LESLQNRLIDKQTKTLTKMDSELTDMVLKLDAMDEGVKTGFSRVDKNLEALDSHINCRRKDTNSVAKKLKIAKGKIKVLEERSHMQCDMIEKLITHIKNMEDHLCCCNEGKGKGKAMEILSSLVLGSPLVLGRPLTGSDGSYHTPLVASSPVVSSKENIVIKSKLVEIKDKVMEVALPVPAPKLDYQGIAHLLVVRGQRAVQSKGPPHSAYHPYTCCCAIGD